MKIGVEDFRVRLGEKADECEASLYIDETLSGIPAGISLPEGY